MNDALQVAWEKVKKARQEYLDSRYTGYCVTNTGERIGTGELKREYERAFEEYKKLKSSEVE